ncbi:unnamed protein product [Symbiodinium pilosum]|uniref:Uncharacterized protein n=1 Tax=Symbiodinium pilosum TaxID=2952 RepID=A0A812LZZ0_SYMPI|nr:unnamed protein product [Symbiodinium pilosum]
MTSLNMASTGCWPLATSLLACPGGEGSGSGGDEALGQEAWAVMKPEDEVEKKPEEHELRREEYNAAEDNVHVQVAVQGDVLVVAVVASIVQEALVEVVFGCGACEFLLAVDVRADLCHVFDAISFLVYRAHIPHRGGDLGGIQTVVALPTREGYETATFASEGEIWILLSLRFENWSETTSAIAWVWRFIQIVDQSGLLQFFLQIGRYFQRLDPLRGGLGGSGVKLCSISRLGLLDPDFDTVLGFRKLLLLKWRTQINQVTSLPASSCFIDHEVLFSWEECEETEIETSHPSRSNWSGVHSDPIPICPSCSAKT